MSFTKHVPRREHRAHPGSTPRGDRGGRHGPGAGAREAAGGSSSSASAASAGHASHAVNDFRKICGFEAYAPTDNVSRAHRARERRGLGHLLRRVAHGSRLRAGRRRAGVLGRRRQPREERLREPRPRARARARGRRRRSSASSAATAATRRSVADACVLIPTVAAERITPHTEGFVRGRLAPAGEPPRAAAVADQVGERRVSTRERAGHPRSRRHADRRRPRRGDRRDRHRVPSRSAAPPRPARWRGCARSPARASCWRWRPTSRARRRGRSPARPSRAPTPRCSRCSPREGVSIAAVEVCMHHPDGGPGGDPSWSARAIAGNPGRECCGAARPAGRRPGHVVGHRRFASPTSRRGGRQACERRCSSRAPGASSAPCVARRTRPRTSRGPPCVEIASAIEGRMYYGGGTCHLRRQLGSE